MFKEKRELITYIAGLAVLLVAGIIIGYYLWGTDREESANYTQYLSKTIDYIKSLEEANLILTEKTVALQDHIETMSDEANDPAKLRDEIDVLTQKIEEIKKENTSLQSTIAENEKGLKAAAALQAEHENLLNEVKTLVKQNETLEATVNEGKSLIEENDRLQAVIDKLKNDLAASKAQIEAVQQVVTPNIVSEQPAQ